MTSRLLLTPLAMTVLVLAVALAGCSTGATSASKGSPAGGAADAPSKHATFTIPTSCLPASEVSALLGLPENGPTVSAKADELICEYLTATEDGAIIYYQNKPGASPARLATELTSNPPEGATVTPISHLGDAAYEVVTDGSEGVVVLKGTVVITIAGGQTTLPRVESLAVDVLAG